MALCHHDGAESTTILVGNNTGTYIGEKNTRIKSTTYAITAEEVNQHFTTRRCNPCKKDFLFCHTCPHTKHSNSNDIGGWVNPIQICGAKEVAVRACKHRDNEWHRFFRGAEAITKLSTVEGESSIELIMDRINEACRVDSGQKCIVNEDKLRSFFPEISDDQLSAIKIMHWPLKEEVESKKKRLTLTYSKAMGSQGMAEEMVKKRFLEIDNVSYRFSRKRQRDLSSSDTDEEEAKRVCPIESRGIGPIMIPGGNDDGTETKYMPPSPTNVDVTMLAFSPGPVDRLPKVLSIIESCVCSTGMHQERELASLLQTILKEAVCVSHCYLNDDKHNYLRDLHESGRELPGMISMCGNHLLEIFHHCQDEDEAAPLNDHVFGTSYQELSDALNWYESLRPTDEHSRGAFAAVLFVSRWLMHNFSHIGEQEQVKQFFEEFKETFSKPYENGAAVKNFFENVIDFLCVSKWGLKNQPIKQEVIYEGSYVVLLRMPRVFGSVFLNLMEEDKQVNMRVRDAGLESIVTSHCWEGEAAGEVAEQRGLANTRTGATSTAARREQGRQGLKAELGELFAVSCKEGLAGEGDALARAKRKEMVMEMIREGIVLTQQDDEEFAILRMFILDEKHLSKEQHEKLERIMVVQPPAPPPKRSRTRGIYVLQGPAEQEGAVLERKNLAQLTLDEIHDFCGISRLKLQVVVVEEENEDERRLKAVETGDMQRKYRVRRGKDIKFAVANLGEEEVRLRVFYLGPSTGDGEDVGQGEQEVEGIVLQPMTKQELVMRTCLGEGQDRDTVILRHADGTELRLVLEE
ncbi:hypothetical protein GUITHDRAFT_148929 [Guillardia theta CCMP2712]|uniref:Uncharacterized protein n=1 Tax=Guillardia theta (strain CCMP2712) TaxID=905079 RepID=L1I6V2_GUITC|nr:hypothetical protein GUITHDRAFT_148929 [Guillardia theta CCMP2712]EKX31988.1 hypothetical protein GUITHDRAFT_148929 [Guillardia theta CCMP2712]|eukprot:XP_005818968.1 hypothetical protein GUITHDRAFT_148929 [Guillardia theta CCMP2712]